MCIRDRSESGRIRVTGLREKAEMTLQVLSLDGRVLRVLADRMGTAASTVELSFDAEGLASGVYLIQVVQGTRSKVGRLVVE